MKGYDEMTPDELSEFVDAHLLMALTAADLLHNDDRDQSEYYVQNRLVALNYDFPSASEVRAEDNRRRTARLREALSPERREQRTARDINWGLIAGAAALEGRGRFDVKSPDTQALKKRAFNDPVVDCCGRDAADCDCPTHHIVPCFTPKGRGMVCAYCRVPASELGRDASQLGCPKGPR